MKFVGYARPHPDLLPQEKEQQFYVSGFVDDCPANSVARISRSRRTIPPLLGERAGAGRTCFLSLVTIVSLFSRDDVPGIDVTAIRAKAA